MNNSCGQTLMELVIGLGLIAMVITALAITTSYGLRNSQFSKNQAQATKYAQENLEKVRTIKIENLGVCRPGEGTTACSVWSEIWSATFGTASGGCYTNDGNPANDSCTYVISESPSACTTSRYGVKTLCLVYSNATPVAIPNTPFKYLILMEDESPANQPNPQKKITSRVFWTDTTGEHSSDLVTVFSKI